MKGTVKKVARDAAGICSATISRTDPPPPEDVDILDIPLWAYEDLRAALCGDKPVEVTQDAEGNVTAVAIS